MNEKPEIEVGKLPVITKFIYTLGVLPTSYLMSMTYQEQVTWLYNYLQTQVIPLLNTESGAIQELQTLYELLRTYVNDYFDNLDVQEEINNKLDEMYNSGDLANLIATYINPLINQQNQEINEFKEIINNEISTINNKVNNVSSGSPLVASSSSEMTDTSRIYVNTTDGKWYYYDGDSWEIGGTYQSSEIANNSIDILQLNNDLQKNFFINYSDFLDLGNAYSGFYNKDGTLISSDSFRNYHYSLENGKNYIFTGQDLVQLNSLVIMDSSNNVIYCSNPNSQTQYVTHMFSVKENNLTAYISMSNDETHPNRFSDHILYQLREFSNIYNQLRYSEEIPVVETLDDQYILADNIGLNYIRFGTLSGGYYQTKVYQATKGRKYLISGTNYANVAGCCISDLKASIIWGSSSQNIGQTKDVFNKTYECESDGYILITIINDGSTEEATVKVINEGIDFTETNPLIGLKLGCDGDSIMHGASGEKPYATQIYENNKMALQNISVGGGTITYGTYSGDTPRHWICTSVENLDTDCDIILINGGFNDYGLNIPLGTYINSYSDNVDNTTFYGALETLCRNLLNRFTDNTKIFFVTNHNINSVMYSQNQQGLTMNDYIEAIYKVMKKYGIEIIDIGKNTHLNTAISNFKTNYTKNSDGVHPNTLGYSNFYVPYITNCLKNSL